MKKTKNDEGYKSNFHNQNENRSSFSERVNLRSLITDWLAEIKKKTPFEIFLFLYRTYNVINAIRKLFDYLNSL